MFLLRCVNLSGFTYQVYTPSFRGAVCTPLGGPSLHTLFTYPVYIPVYTSSLRAQFTYLLPGLPPHPTLAVSVSISTLLFLDRLQKPTLCICIARTILQLLNPPTLSVVTQQQRVVLYCDWVSSTHGDFPEWLGVKMCWRIT